MSGDPEGDAPGEPSEPTDAGVDLERLLKRFGLSDKEVDTYLTLLEHGEAKASTLAAAADVSKRYVYSASEALESRGFVTVNDHVTPTTIRANPPAEVIERLSTDAESMRPALEARYARTEPPEAPFEVVKSRATVIKRIRRALAEADEEVVLSFPLARLDELREALADARERDVLVLLLVTGVEEPVDALEADLTAVASVARAWGQPMPAMLTVDERTGVVAPAELLARANSDTQAIVFTQRQLGPVIVGSFLGNYWPVATEVAVAAPASLPATYTTFRHAVLQVVLAKRRAEPEESVRVRVEGHRTEDGGTVELAGPVTALRQGFVRPVNNEFPVQHSLTIATEEGPVTVGGPGAFIEAVEADRVRVEWAE